MGLNLTALPKKIDRRTIIKADNRTKPVRTPVMRLLYNRDVAGIDSTKLTREFMNYDVTVKALVMEGANQFEKFGDITYNLDEKTMPLFKMADNIKASDLENVRDSILPESNFDLNLTTLQNWFNNRYDIAYRHLAITRENIAAQSAAGSIEHTVIAEDNTKTTFELNFGSIANITSAITGLNGDWANASTTLSDILADVERSFKYFTDNIDFTARKQTTVMCLDSTNYYAVRAKADALQQIDNIRYDLISDVTDFSFSVNGWIFVLEEFNYKSGLDFSVDSKALPDKTCQFINLENMHKFRYLKYLNLNNPSYQSQRGSTLRMYVMTEMAGVPLGESANMYFISRFVPIFNTNASCYLTINP